MWFLPNHYFMFVYTIEKLMKQQYRKRIETSLNRQITGSQLYHRFSRVAIRLFRTHNIDLKVYT